MKHTLVVAKFTFTEVYRSKVMTSVIFLALAVLVVTYIASEFAYGAPTKIALDFGLGLTALSNVVMSIFIGSTLLSREIEQKTIYMILSRSISRTSFLIGKIFGLSIVLLVNTSVLVGVSLAVFIYLGGHFQNLILWSAFFTFLEAFILMLFAIFFSLLTNNTLAVIYTTCVFVVGHSVGETAKNLIVKTNIFFQFIIETCIYLLPNFYKLNLKDFILYNQTLPWTYLINILVYASCYILFMFLIISQAFKRKNLD